MFKRFLWAINFLVILFTLVILFGCTISDNKSCPKTILDCEECEECETYNCPTISYVDLDKCHSKCPICGKCTNVGCQEEPCKEKCESASYRVNEEIGFEIFRHSHNEFYLTYINDVNIYDIVIKYDGIVIEPYFDSDYGVYIYKREPNFPGSDTITWEYKCVIGCFALTGHGVTQFRYLRYEPLPF